MDKIREKLAELMHVIWSDWMIYLFSHCIDNEDGSVTIPGDKVRRWRRQIGTPYSGLSDQEKESDRVEANKVIETLKLTVTEKENE